MGQYGHSSAGVSYPGLWTNLWIKGGGLWINRAWLSTGCGFPVDNRSVIVVLVTRCDTGRGSRALVHRLWKSCGQPSR
jgi:hypothetical protein